MDTITVGVNINQCRSEPNGLTVLEDGKTIIKCLRCDYTSDKVTNCRRHFETMHTPLRLPEQCCGISFQTKGEYRDHRKVAHPGGLYFCHLCPAEPVKRKALLVRHMSIHTGIKQHTCKLCGYASPNKFNVKRHMVTHSFPNNPNNKNRALKSEKSSENQNQNSISCAITGPDSNSLVPNPGSSCPAVLPDSTTTELQSQPKNPILRGILNCEGEEKKKEDKGEKSISHSIRDILRREPRGGRVNVANSSSPDISTPSHGIDEPRFPGNTEGAGEIDTWCGTDKSITKCCCHNWSHVSAACTSFSTNTNAYPYQLPLYSSNNSLPPRIQTYNNNHNVPLFYPTLSQLEPLGYFHQQHNFLSPYDTSNFFGGLDATITPENHLPRHNRDYLSVDSESLQLCHQDHSQAVLINQQDSRQVPASLPPCNFRASDSLLPTFGHYSSTQNHQDIYFTEGEALPLLEPTAPVTLTDYNIDIYTEDTVSELRTDEFGPDNALTILSHNSTHNSIPKETLPSSPSKHDDSESENGNEEPEISVEYIPKKLRLSRKFTTNSNYPKT